MPAGTPRPVLVLAALALAVFSIAKRTEASSPASQRADFSGTWALKGGVSDDPFRDSAKQAETSSIGGRPRPGGPANGSGGALGDIPLEALGMDARLLVVTDEGSTLRVTYAAGRKRTLFADGEERELDDGDGPAKVTTKRKGGNGEKVVVSSKWSTGRGLTETWELLANPPRLTVTGKASGLKSYHYQRVYVPATAEQIEAAARRPTATPAPTSTPSEADASPGPVPTPAGMKECSIRPPRGASPADLAGMAKVTREDAEKRAIASVAPLKVTSVITSDLEVDEGCLVWPFDLRLQDKKGVQEVFVDAGDGKVLSSHFEAQNKP